MHFIVFRQYRTLVLVALWFLTTNHEFWIAPSRYQIRPGEITTVDFRVGEDFNGEYWGRRRDRTRSFKQYGDRDSADLTVVAMATDSTPIPIRCAKEGTYLLVMQSQNSYIELEGDKFTAYLEEDGIDAIRDLRVQRGESEKKAREMYQRCAKSLLQAGEKTGAAFAKRCGLPLEIIPLQNPYDLKPGQSLEVQVLYQGKPLVGAAVRSWQKTSGQPTAKHTLRSNAEGKAIIALEKSGEWMVSLVHMIEHPDKSQSDYQSYWASLTFEVR